MAVIKVARTKGYTVMSNYHLRDKNLSLKAKGLMSMMLALPDEWHYNIRGLSAICREGVTSISSTLKELMEYRYVTRHQPVDPQQKKFMETVYTIYEYPQSMTGDLTDMDAISCADMPENGTDSSPLPFIPDAVSSGQKSGVIRVAHTKGYSVMSSYHLWDKTLSLKAKGLLSMMLSLPDEWHYNVRGLSTICREGVTSVSSTIRELIGLRYVTRYQPYDREQKKFLPVIYTIYERPQHLPYTEDRGDGCPEDSNTFPEDTDNGPDAMPCEDAAVTDATAPDAGPLDTGSVYSDPAHTNGLCAENLHTVSPGADGLNAYLNNNQANKERAITVSSNYPSIYPDGSAQKHAAASLPRQDGIERMDRSQRRLLEQMGAERHADQFADYREYVKENICFDSLCLSHPCDRSMLEGIVELIVETVCAASGYIRINGQDMPQSVVKSRFLKLDCSHVEYVLTSLARNTAKIRNIRAYLLTTLYNAPTTLDAYYQNWVQSDNPELAMA